MTNTSDEEKLLYNLERQLTLLTNLFGALAVSNSDGIGSQMVQLSCKTAESIELINKICAKREGEG